MGETMKVGEMSEMGGRMRDRIRMSETKREMEIWSIVTAIMNGRISLGIGG